MLKRLWLKPLLISGKVEKVAKISIKCNCEEHMTYTFFRRSQMATSLKSKYDIYFSSDYQDRALMLIRTDKREMKEPASV